MYSVAEELERLALAVQFLAPSRSDPEKFHLEKSEIVNALRDLAQRGQQGGRRWWRSEKGGRRPGAC
ncbi:hypothetical protein L598_003900000040 [Mesorhizobium sp. J18]|nr:hypothetical protein L598_003900000040 [Mesorhizobium sp. J18]